MKMYLADWAYDCTIKPVEIIKRTEKSVWVFENGKERNHLIVRETSMYCLTYELAREKVISEKAEIIRIHKARLETYETILYMFLENYPITQKQT